MKKKNPNSLTALLERLNDLNIDELLLLFIEAKTGNIPDAGEIPCIILNTITALGEDLNIFYADRIKDKLFTEPE